MRRIFPTVVALLLAITFVVPAHAQEWWNDEWAYRKRIDIDPASLGITEPVIDAPVLVRLHVGNFSYFGDMRPDGSDLRVIASDDITPLKFQIESFDPLAQVALVWVTLPQILPAIPEQFFYLYYGNAEAPAAAADAGFDKNYVAAFHFAPPQPLVDSTAYNNRLLANVALTPQPGLIGQGIRLDGTEYLDLAGSPVLAILPERGWTFATWINADAPQVGAVILEATDGITQQGFSLRLDGLTPELVLSGAVAEPANAAVPALRASTALVAGQWQHLALRLSGTQAQLFIDGAAVGQSQATLPSVAGAMRLGNSQALDAPLSGVRLDEVRFSNVARSPSALGLAARGQGMDSTALFYGEDSQRDDSGHESHLVTTLRNVDWGGLEGIVVFICIVMAFCTWYLMAVKGVNVGRARRANMSFLESYRAAQDPVSVHEQSTLGGAGSTLGELYELGMDEIGKRVHLGSVGAAATGTLSRESVSSIRAIMTGHNVRISQRLNSMMVLLTLAIAGGPFLGLLGTVVGVMVTFAGIAASGDVNINAIAPGIAAALVATVAGLIVAIPALFGYNYISSRIKEVITENNVFLEEFIATVTEDYQE